MRIGSVTGITGIDESKRDGQFWISCVLDAGIRSAIETTPFDITRFPSEFHLY